jgi:hypothetical protein
MANEEHVALLRRGVEIWNAWRKENSDIVPDLSGASLSGADLTAASLIGTALAKADLREAMLIMASLSGADLTAAFLTGADLREAMLTRARQTDANLGEVILYETLFVDVNLAQVKGLETCRHQRPSTVDHRTMQRSGPLPLSFLRGVGLPDNLIDYLPSLLNQPIQFYSCFISYSSRDEDFAQRLHADLQNKGIRCWFAPHDMDVGDKIRTRIDEEIRIHEKGLRGATEQKLHFGLGW